MFVFEKQFREENPQTVGETDAHFDLANYTEWLEKKLLKVSELSSDDIEKAGLVWKEALGLTPFRNHAHKDFSAGAAWVKLALWLK